MDTETLMVVVAAEARTQREKRQPKGCECYWLAVATKYQQDADRREKNATMLQHGAATTACHVIKLTEQQRMVTTNGGGGQEDACGSSIVGTEEEVRRCLFCSTARAAW